MPIVRSDRHAIFARRKAVADASLDAMDRRRKHGPQVMARRHAGDPSLNLPPPRESPWRRRVAEDGSPKKPRYKRAPFTTETSKAANAAKAAKARSKRCRAAVEDAARKRLIRTRREKILLAVRDAAKSPWTGTLEVVAMADALAKAEREAAWNAAAVIEMNETDKLGLRLATLGGVPRPDICAMMGWSEARLEAVLTDPRSPGIVAEMRREMNKTAEGLAERMTKLGPRAADVLERATERETNMTHQLRGAELILSKLVPTVTAQKIDVRHAHVLDDDTFNRLVETGREMLALGAISATAEPDDMAAVAQRERAEGSGVESGAATAIPAAAEPDARADD